MKADQSQYIEAEIPPGMTCADYRRQHAHPHSRWHRLRRRITRRRLPR